MRRFFTKIDISRLPPSSVLEVEEDDVITPDAWEEAALRHIDVRKKGKRVEIPGFAAQAASASVSGQGTRVIVTAVGMNHPGVLAELTSTISTQGGNVHDISQRIIQEYFHLFVLVDISSIQGDFQKFKESIEKLTKAHDMVVSVHHEKVFRSLYRIE
ncbi:MAG: ACT domain-containing protein [Planctomycetes bacterium]|nr:ACT domain-containing protein [Planctomycetota bacterium]